jgi:hypothetical protein
MDNEKVMTAVRAWLTPFLLIAVATVLYDDINEMKSDIKQLLAQSSADAVKIERLEQEVDALRLRVYTTNQPSNNNENDKKQELELIAVLPSKPDDYIYKSVVRKL